MTIIEQTSAAFSANTVLGQIDRCQEGQVSGWAARESKSLERLTVELTVDAVAVSRIVADMHRPDVEEAGISDGRCGFSLSVPDAFFDGTTHFLDVRDAATGARIPGGPIEFNETTPPVRAREASTAHAGDSSVRGGVPAALLVPRIGQDPAPEVVAVPQVAPAAEVASVQWSALAPAVSAHQTRAPDSMAGAASDGESEPVTATIQGRLDHWLADAFVGWAARADGASVALDVDLVIDGTPAVRAIANLHRADLAAANIGAGRHGFRIEPPEGLFDNQPHVVEIREAISGETVVGSPVTIRFNACHLWDNSADDDNLRRRKLADLALAHCEGAEAGDFDDTIHQILLRMRTWLQGQPPGRQARRLETQLRRLAALRCRLEAHGFIGAHVIGGSVVDNWATGDAVVTLELLEEKQVIATADCVQGPDRLAGGTFAFALPEALFDDEVHRFEIRAKAFGGTIGAWSLLLAAPGQGQRAASRFASDPIWETLPAVVAARKSKVDVVETTKVEAAQFALEDALDAGLAEDSEGLVQLTLALASALQDAGQWQQAHAQFEAALGLDATCGAAVAGQVSCLLALGDESNAEARLEWALEEFPDERALYRLADELRARRQVRSVRTVAFYLPQFHPTPENDAWWGKGFTEWSNVGGAVPLFDGHLQPRRPTSLGYYDLRLAESANAQFDLARRYGIDGFCYYYYWFNGRRVLERPLMDLVSGRTGPFPFCICWANEPWTRSWDGTSGEVLLAQNHTVESDLEFIKDLAPLLRHKDYIRVNGKPVVMVYRAEKLAQPRETVERWRAWCREEGIGELHLCVVQSFGFNDPRPFGFDAAVEFPPHSPSTVYPDWEYHKELTDITGRVPGFDAKIFDYQTFASGGIKRPREPFGLHRTAMVAWDNTARRGKSAHVFHRFSLETFERWVLANARKAAVEQGDAVSFVNAWNEWAEGSVMEPDAHFGYEILEATRRAKRLANFDPDGTYWRHEAPMFPEDRLTQRERIILIGHDAFFAGAQTNLLNIARTLKRQLQMDVVIMLIEGGDLLPEYERVAPTYVIGTADGWQDRLRDELRRYRVLGARKAICNTVVTGDVVAELKKESFRVLSLVHELPALIESYNLSLRCWTIADKADHLVFASRVVADEFCDRYWPESPKRVIAPQGIAFNNYHELRDAKRSDVRKELRLPAHCSIVLGCGHGDTRKGIDLFVKLAADVSRQCEPGAVAFVWVGTLEWQLEPYIQADVGRLGLTDIFRVTGRTTDPGRYFIASELFALTSREDPFPSVVMEAFDAKLPVLAFAGGGGYVDIVNDASGALVPYLDVAAMASAAVSYLRDPARREEVGERNHLTCRERFGYVPYLKKLLALLAHVPGEQVTAGVLERRAWFDERPRPSITAIIPNFNYARYLELRLRSVVEQTLPPDEIIVLDDASTDSSLELIRAFAAQSSIPVQVVTCDVNTGSPFVQWAKGFALAKGDLIWIAEADDYCEPILLETLAREFTADNVTMAWADSIMVDEKGQSQGAQYKIYYERNYGVKWRMPFRMDGRELIEECLLVENVVPNASAVLFRRDAVSAADVAAIQQYRFSGDWWFWLSLAQTGIVSYVARPLNYHRRHNRSVMGEVLRAGPSLMRETMGFYERIAARKPECISASAGLQVLNRLQRIFESMPELVAQAPRVAEHPDLSAQYAALVQQFQGVAGQHQSLRSSATVVVLSEDVMAEDKQGAALVRHLHARERALKVVLVGPADDGDAFLERLGMPGLDSAIVATQARTPKSPADNAKRPARSLSEIGQELRTAVGDLSAVNVVTHGLLAHCQIAGMTDVKQTNWTIVASTEFESILGHLPKVAGVTVDGIRDATRLCGRAQFLGAWPPHVLARLAKANALPVEQLHLRTAARRKASEAVDSAVRFLGIAEQTSAQQWQLLAARVSALAAESGHTARLRLLTWNSRQSDLSALENERDIELIQIYDRPAALASLGDVMVLSRSNGWRDHTQFLLEVQEAGMPAMELEALIENPAKLFSDVAAKWPSGHDIGLDASKNLGHA